VLAALVAVTFSATLAQLPVDRQGHPQARVQGKSQKPKEVVDTIRLSGGKGYVVLNKAFSRNQHTTAKSPSGYIYTIAGSLLSDTSATVYAYACHVNSKGDSIVVKSSSATDTSLVVVRAFVK